MVCTLYILIAGLLDTSLTKVCSDILIAGLLDTSLTEVRSEWKNACKDEYVCIRVYDGMYVMCADVSVCLSVSIFF